MLRAPSLLVPAPLRVPGGGSPGVQPLRVCGLGIGPGDHVAFCLENRIEFLALAWGAHYAGCYYTAISSRLTADEIAYIVDDCGAQVFVTSPYKADDVAEIMSATPAVEARFSIGGPVEGHACFEDAVAAQAVERFVQDDS